MRVDPGFAYINLLASSQLELGLGRCLSRNTSQRELLDSASRGFPARRRNLIRSKIFITNIHDLNMHDNKMHLHTADMTLAVN